MSDTENHVNLLEMFNQGQFQCTSCNETLQMSEVPPLSICICTNCEGENLAPAQIAGFWLYKELAVGGMGAVYFALHADYPEDTFAMKILPRDHRDNETLIKNIKDEIGVMKALGGNEAMVAAVAAGHEDNEYFLVTRYIKGNTLDDLIVKHGKIHEDIIIQVALRILSAESYIFKQGYLYRDLKPENILIEEGGIAYLCDFGICMPISQAHQDLGDLIQGSPFYIPPERLMGEGEHAYSEIYSLGLVMYHALSGKLFYNATDIEEIAKMHVNSTSDEDMISHMQGLAPDLSNVIINMIQRNPADRYQTFLEVERDLFKIFTARSYIL
ncbi:MAG: protein kinase [Lentisphaeria bacterium]|nr:protein kinase [Lentisphaeria bacterium]